MIKLIPVIFLVSLSGCAGSFAGLFTPVDLERAEKLVSALEHMSGSATPNVLAMGAGEANVVTGECGDHVRAMGTASDATRSTLTILAVEACGMPCPARVGGEPTSLALAEVARHDPAGAIRGIVKACDDAGLPDTVFGGSLAPLREGMSISDYLGYRFLFGEAKARLSGSPAGDALWARLERMRPAVALALDGRDERAPDAAITTAFDASVPAADVWAHGPVVLGALAGSDLSSVFAADDAGLRACVTDHPGAAPKPPTGERPPSERSPVIAALKANIAHREGAWPEDGSARLLLELVLGGDGQLWSANVRGASVPAAASECVLGRVRALSFPRTGDGDLAMISWPMRLADIVPVGADGPAADTPAAAAPFGSSVVVTRPPIVLGALDATTITATVGEQRAAFRACYETGLAGKPGLGGEVEVKFTINRDGTVSAASITRTTLNHTAVEACVREQFLKLRFPEPKGGGIVIVRFPLVFSAE